jgi:hypothetical protein
MSGMVFVSKGFPPGSPGYKTLTSFVAMVVIVSTSSFVIFVAFEVCGHAGALVVRGWVLSRHSCLVVETCCPRRESESGAWVDASCKLLFLIRRSHLMSLT